MTRNYIRGWGLRSEDLGSEEYTLITITSRPTLTWSGITF